MDLLLHLFIAYIKILEFGLTRLKGTKKIVQAS